MAGDNFSSWSLCSQRRQASTFSSGSSCSKTATSGGLSISQSRAAPASPSAPVLCNSHVAVFAAEFGAVYGCRALLLESFPILIVSSRHACENSPVRPACTYVARLRLKSDQLYLVQPPRTVYSPQSTMCPHEGVIQRLSPHSLRTAHVVVAQHLRCT